METRKSIQEAEDVLKSNLKIINCEWDLRN